MAKRGAEGLEHSNDDHNPYDTDAMNFTRFQNSEQETKCLYLIQCLFFYRNIKHIFSFGTKIIKKLCYCDFCYQNHGCFGIEQIDDKGKRDKNTRYMDTKLCFKCSNQDVNAQRIFATCARN